ncbi:ABC transporter ATP-binding protein [Arthrobacter sp. W4I7]|uniref:ABC transporter ATP-binding protein n=1 Tax=Arthrobacter sp. W4I7 TaxID=3042296 RepID=UPI00277EE1D9|nr:ABC transporter ATP-binding protein [Arthrobacter sp. W4I7]MDQ0691451.1 peptide/nickel transport system ATP-binding protein [Arthrobacter sp. W4I7]
MTRHNQQATASPARTSIPLIEVNDLTVEFGTPANPITIASRVSFTIEAGRTLGLVGESGSGKTVTSQAMIGLTRFLGGRIVEGQVLLEGRNLVVMPERELRELRGRDVGMIFQQANRSLNPAFSVGDQIAETARRHLGLSRKMAWARAVAMLERVGIADARRRAKAYPHEFSGGMCQRVMIATALVCEPRLLIADEPTTALDVTVQRTILDLLRRIQDETDIAILFISHDLGVIAQMCDDVAVMYAGQIVENGPVSELFSSPQHPYTSALLGAIPQGRGIRPVSIPGVVPAATDFPSGCRFADRCGFVEDECRKHPQEIAEARNRALGQVRCRRAADLVLPGVQVVAP